VAVQKVIDDISKSRGAIKPPEELEILADNVISP
jgi:hypothetical protein